MENRLVKLAVALAVIVVMCVVGAVGVPVGLALYRGAQTIQQLLGENKELRRAIAHLTHEDQVGYAKVLEQHRDAEGILYTKLLFVETDRNDPMKRLLEKEYVVAGDVVHFDALVVTFDVNFVTDGRERALFMWRRVYGETMKPEDGFPIETPGEAPERYKRIFARLSPKEGEIFWEGIWDLANEPGKLREQGVKAVNGTAVYNRLKPDRIYVFKVGSTGTFKIEVMPQL